MLFETHPVFSDRHVVWNYGITQASFTALKPLDLVCLSLRACGKGVGRVTLCSGLGCWRNLWKWLGHSQGQCQARWESDRHTEPG